MRKALTRTRAGIAAIVMLAAFCFVPNDARSWGGWPHSNLGEDMSYAFSPEVLHDTFHVLGYPYIEREPAIRPFMVLPEIDETMVAKLDGGDPNDEEVAWVEMPGRLDLAVNTMTEDDYDLVTTWGADYGYDVAVWVDSTVTHFWDADESVMHDVKGQFTDTYPNGWMKAKILWERAVYYWRANDKGMAYMYLGHVLHLLMDQGIACHAHNDWHPPDENDDSLEEWFKDLDSKQLLYSWTQGVRRPQPPGGLLTIPPDAEIRAALVAADPEWMNDPELLDDSLNADFNTRSLFYLMYTVNQYGDFSPSDDYDGDEDQAIPWANYNDGIIEHFDADGEPLTGLDSQYTLRVNDSGNDDDEGHLNSILKVGWRAAYRAAPVLIDLFRRTVDNAPPVSVYELTRLDGQPVVEWNNSPVTVHITDAVDTGRLGYRPAEVWKKFGRCDRISMSELPDTTAWCTVGEDGEHAIEFMSTDKVGNVEAAGHDITVKIDTTPPDVELVAIRPNYLTSESFYPVWNATDATSGVASEIAYLDGKRVIKEVEIPLAELAGKHLLEVYAADAATNMRYVSYEFEVWIDANAFAKPVVLSTRADGEGLMVFVEFPKPYDVGLIALPSAALRVGATIDLHERWPVMGGNLTVAGTALTGIADRDRDDLVERAIRFDKGAFASAVAGTTGDVVSVVSGALDPDGAQRYIATVTIPVFTPPR